ncbi:hypothetical protein [Nocardia sp. NBC_00511]|uniref:hypothetical protein n=1 Tax=Nocardia sp. NBC_00511 TaxID=2903591 RepID=UPI0030E37BAA
MPPASEMLRYTIIYLLYILLFAAFYCAVYLLIHVLPVDLNPPIQVTCPPSSPIPRAT